MEAKRSSGRGWAWAAAILLFLIASVYAGWQYFKKDLANPQSKVAKPMLTDKLKKMILEASDSLYHIQYDKFDIDIDAGKGIITNFKLIPDTEVYKRLVALHKAPDNVLQIRMDSLILNGFGFTKTPAGRRFNIAGMALMHPIIKLVNKRRLYNDTVAKTKAPLLVKLMKDMLKITSVQNLKVRDLLLTYVDQNGKKEKSTTLRHWGISMNNFVVDEAEDNTGQYRAQHKKALFAKVKLIQIATPDSLYHVNFSGIMFSPEKRTLSLDQFTLVPRLSIEAFYKAVKFDKDRMHFVYNHMVMRNIDVHRLLQRQQLHIGTAIVGSSWSEIYNNYYWPRRKPPLRPHPFPHQKLKDLAFDITIDTMIMHKGYFQYVIAAKRSQEEAKLFMTDMDGRITNITNNAQIIKQHPYSISNMSCLIMGAGKANINYTFNLASKNGAFSNTLEMGPMDGRALNPLAKPLAMMAITSASINKLYMRLDADSYSAKGNINLYYTGMKVSLLKHDDNTDTLKKKGFLSFLTNAVLPNDNPKKDGKFRKGPFNVTRDPRESFFGLLWDCTLDGMSSAMMGFDQKKQKPNENMMMKVIKKVIKPQKEISKINK